MTARTTLAGALVLSAGLALAVVAAPPVLGGEGTPASRRTVALSPRPIASNPAWDGPQFIGADRQGRVFLLRGTTLEVYPFVAGGRLGKPVKPEGAGTGGPRLRAVMSADGTWIVREGVRVRAFRGGKETPVGAPEWLVSNVGALRGDPVASVEPARIVPGRRGGDEVPPLVLRWTGKVWEPLVAEALPAGTTDPMDMALREERDVELHGDSAGTLWVASSNRYLIRRFSATGRLRLKLAVGDGTVRRQPAPEGLGTALDERAKRLGTEAGRPVAKTTAQAATAVTVIAALAEGRDGRMYFLVSAGDGASGFVLDRYDPVRVALERTPLALDDPGRITMASGKDGLYLAAHHGRRGRWLLSWESLEAAAWEPVAGAMIDDLPLGRE